MTYLNAMDSKSEASKRSLFVILEHSVGVDLLNAVDVARKQRRDLLAGTIGTLYIMLYHIVFIHQRKDFYSSDVFELEPPKEQNG